MSGVGPGDTKEVECRGRLFSHGTEALASEKFIFSNRFIISSRLRLEDDVVAFGILLDLTKPELCSIFSWSDDENVIQQNEDSTTTFQRDPRKQLGVLSQFLEIEIRRNGKVGIAGVFA